MISKILQEYVGSQLNKKFNNENVELGIKEYFDSNDQKAYRLKIVDLKKVQIEKIIKPYHLVSSSFINDLIISHLVNKLSDQYPTIGKFYGYQIKKGLLISVKSTHFTNFREFLKSCQEPIRSLMILHLLLTISVVFQSNYYTGYCLNLNVDDIFVDPTEKVSVSYKINGHTFNIPTCGYLPVISEFGKSQILKIGKKPVLIKSISSPDLSTNIFDRNLDSYLLMCTNNYKQFTLMSTIKLAEIYRKLLKTEYKINDKLTYKPNTLSIEKFILDNDVQKFLINKCKINDNRS